MKISQGKRRSMSGGCLAALMLMCAVRAHAAESTSVSPPDHVNDWSTAAQAPVSSAANASPQDPAAPDPGSVSSPDQWKYAVTVYGFLPSVYGETTFPGGAAGPSFTINQHKIISSLKFAFMGTLRARKGDWGYLADLFYSDLGDSVSASRDFRLAGKPPVGATADLRLRSKTTMLTVAGTYALMDTPRDSMSLLFGTRMIDMRQKLNWTLSATIPGLWTGALSGQNKFDHTYWDAIVGFTGRTRFGDQLRWFVPYHLDVGTGASKFTGQAVLGIGYTTRWGEVTAAWRYIDYNFKSSETVSRLAFSGPALGVTYRF
jgi:hypothetical protein